MKFYSIRYLDFFAFVVILLFLSPYFILQQQVHVTIWDNLDSEISWFKILAESGKNWSTDDVIPNIFNGLTRLSYQSNLNFYHLLFYIGPFFAFVVNKVLTVIVAFIGMKMFLSRYVFGSKSNFMCYGVALCFAFLPFWPSTSLSIASLPLAFYVFLDIRRGSNSILSWLVIFLLPFFTDFTRVYLFFIIVIGCIWLFDLFKKKKLNFRFFLAIFLLFLLFLLVEYRLIIYALDQPFQSHRNQFKRSTINFFGFLKKSAVHFVIGQGHVKTLHTYVILPVTGVVAFGLFFKKSKFRKLFYINLITLILFSLIYGLFYYGPFAAIYNSSLNPLRALQINRFFWLNPFLWYLLFAMGLVIIQKKWSSLRYFLILIILSQLFVIFLKSPQFKTLYKFEDETLTYQEFFSESLFYEVKSSIPEEKSEFKTLSLGIHPAIAQYNGFFTLDGYIGNYPLSYKHEFREIIKEELNQSKELKDYYDDWGSRVYLFSSELGRNFKITKNSPIGQVNNLNLDYTKIKDMGGLYIFSAVEIKNYKQNSLNLIDVFESETSPWRIFLYKIK